MNFLKPKGIVAVGLLTASVAMLGFSSGSSAEESSLTPELKAELQALIDSYRGEPEFVAPGDPIDIKAALGGKLIYGISVTSANPFTEVSIPAFASSSRSSVFEFKDWQNQGSLAEHQRGISQAITDGAAIIDLTGGSDPGSWVRNSRKRAPQELR